jgi:hypothetical protein
MSGWHCSDDLLARYAIGESGMAVTASTEAHLLACPACRERVAAYVRQPLEGTWTRVVAEIQTPPQPTAIRVLRRVGLGDSDAVLLSASSSLTGAWTLSMLAIIAFSALAAMVDVTQGRTLYLTVAPLVPVLGVVVAFRSVDPLAGLVRATPYSHARLVLLRALTVAVCSVPAAVAIGLAVPGISTLAFGWLLPSIALTLLALIGLTRWHPEPVGLGVAALWIAVIAYAGAGHGVTQAVGASWQPAYLAAGVVGAVGLALQFRSGVRS